MFVRYGAGKPAAAYQRLGVEMDVAQANPHQLVTMLFDALNVALGQAKSAMERGDIAAKGRQIGIAVRIVEEGLSAALNLDDGGALAQNLKNLYAYCVQRLTQANAQNDPSALAEVQKLIETVSTSWKAIASTPSTQLQAA